MRAWSRELRLAPVVFLEMSLQKPPISLATESIGRPQRVVSPMPAVPTTPGKVWP